MCLTAPEAKRRPVAVGAAFEACDELPALIVSGATLYIGDDRYYNEKQVNGPTVLKASVLHNLRATNRDFKRAVDSFLSKWMTEAVGLLQACREAYLQDSRSHVVHFETRWDEAVQFLGKMLFSQVLCTLRKDLVRDGNCVYLGNDACTFFSLVLGRCQMKAVGMCQCKGANLKHITSYELEDNKCALFARRECLTQSCVPVGPLQLKSESQTTQLTNTMLRMRKQRLPVCNERDFVKAIGRPSYSLLDMHKFGSVMLVKKHPSVTNGSVQERLGITPKELAECTADIARRRSAKEKRFNVIRDMIVQEAIADVDAALAGSARAPVDTIAALTELCEGMGTHMHNVVSENATANMHALDAWNCLLYTSPSPRDS